MIAMVKHTGWCCVVFGRITAFGFHYSRRHYLVGKEGNILWNYEDLSQESVFCYNLDTTRAVKWQLSFTSIDIQELRIEWTRFIDNKVIVTPVSDK